MLSIGRNYLVYLLSPVARAAVSFLLLIPITTYYLDPRDFGIYAVLVAITNLVPALSVIGPSWVMAAHHFSCDTVQRAAMISALAFITLCISVFWAAIFFITGNVVIERVISDPSEDLRVYYNVALIAAFMNCLWPIASNFLILEKQAISHSSVELGAFIANVSSVIIALVFLNAGTLSLFIGPAAGAIVTLLLSLWILRNQLRPKALSKRWLAEVIRRGAPALPASLSETGHGSAERLFLSLWAGLHDLGIYAHSQSYRQVFSWGSKAFNAVFMPEALRYFHEQRSGNELESIVRPWIGMLAIAAMFTALFSEEIIAFLTHDKFTDAAPFVFLWCIFLMSQTYGLPYTQYLLLKKKTAFVSLSGVLSNIFTIVTAAVLIYGFGIYGAAAATLTGMLCLQLTRRWFAVRLGCRPVAEREFLSVFVLSFLFFGMILLMEPGLLWKTVVFLAVSGVLAMALNVGTMLMQYRITPTG